MDLMQIRAVPGSSLHLVGDITDLDSRSHEVQVEFPHERVDSFKTTFGTRAFEDSFKEQLPIMVWAHDLRDPIGRGVRAQVLPQHNEVIGRFSDLEKVPSAARAFAQIDDGTITDFSFGYINGREYPHPNPELRRRGVRQIPRATMREFSPVSIGSIPGAKVAGVREDGNLVTADSPESICRLVELKIITPEVGNQLLRDFGLLDGVRDGGPGTIGAASGVPWTVADAVAHLAEAHGMSQYSAGMARMTPQTLAIIHSQVGGGFHDHGVFAGWLSTIAAAAAQAAMGGGSTTTLFAETDQAAANAFAAAAGYSVQSGVAAHGQGDWGPNPTQGSQTANAGAVGYQVSGGRAAEPEGWSGERALRADDILELVERHNPAMAVQLREAKLALAPAEMDILFRDANGGIIDGDGEPLEGPTGGGAPDGSYPPELTELALNVDAALDSARQWMEGADTSALPEEVRQALALVGAAADGSDAMVEVLGAVGARAAQDSDGDDDGDMSDTPWSDFDESDYSPEQWASACLIDKGTGDGKSRYALPVKEPSGKLNKNGVAAAARRIDQVKGAPADEVKKAARRLMALHGQMKKPTPPTVLKVLGKGERADQEELAAAEELLNSRLAQRVAK